MDKPTIADLQKIIETEGQGVIEMLPNGSIRRRSAEEFKQFQKDEAERKCQAAATPRRHLIKELLDPRGSITEREHAAVRLIGELASRLGAVKMERRLLSRKLEEAQEIVERLNDLVVELGGNPDMIAEADRPQENGDE